MSIKYDKHLLPSLNFFLNCISARSVAQIFSIKGDCIFRLLNFLVIDLCNSSAETLFKIFSFSILQKSFYRRNCKPLKQDLFDIHHITIFQQHRILHHAIFCQKLLFQLNLQNLHKPYYVQNMIYLVRLDKYIFNLLFL